VIHLAWGQNWKPPRFQRTLFRLAGAVYAKVCRSLIAGSNTRGYHSLRQVLCCRMRGLREVDLLDLPNGVLRRFTLRSLLRPPCNALVLAKTSAK